MAWGFVLVLSLAVNRPYTAADVTISYVSGTSPTLVLGLDNNLEICLATTSAMSLEELRAQGIAISDSQRVLLQAFGILGRVGNNYRCELPVFRDAVTARVRADAETIAATIVANTAEARKELLQAISANPGGPPAYPVLASFVLDHLVWKELQSQGLLASAQPETMPTSSKLWSGYSWIMIPPRQGKFGTNDYSSGGTKLLITWTPAALPAVNAVTADLRQALLSGDIAAANAETRRRLEDLGLIEGTRAVVGEIRAGSRIHQLAVKLSRQVAASFAEAFDVASFGRHTGISDSSKAALIMWHEVFPAVMRRLDGEIRTPAVLTGDPGGSIRDAMVLFRDR